MLYTILSVTSLYFFHDVVFFVVVSITLPFYVNVFAEVKWIVTH